MGIFDFLTSKQRQIEVQLDEYCKEAKAAVVEMNETIKICQGKYDRPLLDERIRIVHSHEAKADDIRDNLEVMMYSKALFPESRRDIMRLLEYLDKVPNQAEKVVWMLKTHHIVVPDEFAEGFLKLGETVDSCVEAVLEAVNLLFANYANAAVWVGKTDQLESEIDLQEAELVDQVFSTEGMTGTKKLLMRDLIQAVASISDRAENTGDHIRLIVAKRGL